MKPSVESLEADEQAREHAVIAFKVAEECRKLGLRVSTAEIVEAARLLQLYHMLKKNALSTDDYYLVLAAVYAKRSGDEDKVRKAVARVLAGRRGTRDSSSALNSVARDLSKLKLDFGSHVPRARIKSLVSRDANAREAYARLKLLGIIRSGRRGEYVVSLSKAEDILNRLVRKHGSINEALSAELAKSIAQGSFLVSLLGSDIFKYLDPRKLTADMLTKLYRLLRGDASARRYVSKILADKVRKGESVSNPDEVYSVLNREKLIDSDILANLVKLEPRLSQRILRDYGESAVRDAAEKIARHNPSRAAEVIASAFSLGKEEKLAIRRLLASGRRDAAAFSGTISKDKARILSRMELITNYIGQALADPYLRDAYIEMARAEYEKLVNEVNNRRVLEDSLAEEYEFISKLVETASSENFYASLSLLVRRLNPLDAIRLLSSAAGDERLRRHAVKLAYITLKSLQLRVGGRSRRKLLVRAGCGRIDVRRAVYSLARLNLSNLLRLQRARRGRVILVLDKSGSMKDYAIYAMLAAVTAIPSASRFVLFDSNVTVVSNTHRMSLLRLVEIILSTNYSGYTNIVGALKEATRGISPSKLIVISDLRQTVKTNEDVVATFRSLVHAGWRITVITPPSVDADILDQLREMVRVYIAHSPSEAAKLAYKAVIAL